MSSTQDGRGAAQQMAATEILRVSEASGPQHIVVTNESDGDDVVLQVTRKSTSAVIVLAEDTEVSNEDTVYNGDTTTLSFTGQDLNNTPIVPGTVVIEPTAGGDTVDATDKDSDGKLYTDDVDLDYCGTINYFTGALVLTYPAGKAPNTTNILADYNYSLAVVPGGKRVFNVSNLSPKDDEVLIIKAAGETNSIVRIEVFSSF